MRDTDSIHNIKNNGEVGLIPATKALLRLASTRRIEEAKITAQERKEWLQRLGDEGTHKHLRP